MYFNSWASFVSMDGHGLYVWSAYAIALIVIVYNLLAPFIVRRVLIEQIDRQEQFLTSRLTASDSWVFDARHDNSMNRGSFRGSEFNNMTETKREDV